MTHSQFLRIKFLRRARSNVHTTHKPYLILPLLSIFDTNHEALPLLLMAAASLSARTLPIYKLPSLISIIGYIMEANICREAIAVLRNCCRNGRYDLFAISAHLWYGPFGNDALQYMVPHSTIVVYNAVMTSEVMWNVRKHSLYQYLIQKSRYKMCDVSHDKHATIYHVNCQ